MAKPRAGRADRGVLPVPFTHIEGSFGWGVWAEVDRATHDFHLEHFSADNTQAQPASGRLANRIPAHPDLGAEPLEMRFQDETSRPELHLLPRFSHPFAREQQEGVSAPGHHAYLVASGHFREDA